MAQKLKEYSEISFSRLNNAVMALSALLGFLMACYAILLKSSGYGVHLQAFQKQLSLWLKSCGKEKKVYNTALKVS